MKKKINKRETLAEKIIRGVKIGRQKMLEEKSLKGEFVVYYDKGKIIKENAIDILKREKKIKLRNSSNFYSK